VYSEYGALKKVLVGRADGFRLPEPEFEPLLEDRANDHSKLFTGKPYPQEVIDTANESLEELVRVLENEGVECIRSDMSNPANHTERVGNRGYSTRDVMTQVGDVLYLTPTFQQSRATEAEDCFSFLLEEYRARGKLVDCRTDEWKAVVNATDDALRAKDEGDEREFMQKVKAMGRELNIPEDIMAQIPEFTDTSITEAVPVWDAANVLVVSDKHVLYLVSCSGNWNGFMQLSREMAQHGISVVPVPSDIYSGTHIDTTFAVLNSEYVLYNSDRMTLDQAHRVFKCMGFPDKDRNYIGVGMDDMYDVGLWHEDQNVASAYIGMNLLALDPNTLVVEAHQTSLIERLKTYGFRILSVPYKHMRSMGGGVHCTTLPLARE